MFLLFCYQNLIIFFLNKEEFFLIKNPNMFLIITVSFKIIEYINNFCTHFKLKIWCKYIWFRKKSIIIWLNAYIKKKKLWQTIFKIFSVLVSWPGTRVKSYAFFRLFYQELQILAKFCPKKCFRKNKRNIVLKLIGSSLYCEFKINNKFKRNVHNLYII